MVWARLNFYLGVTVLKPNSTDGNVCFAPEIGRNWVTEFMSAYDPNQKLMTAIASRLYTLTSMPQINAAERGEIWVLA